MKNVICLLILSVGCSDSSEFTFPEAKDKPVKASERILLAHDFEPDAQSWYFELSHPQSADSFVGERTEDAALSGHYSLKLARKAPSTAVTDGYYAFASWKTSLLDVEVPFNADLRFLGHLRLEAVRGTGISLRINLKNRGVQVAFTESGWINGNGQIQDFRSFGCRYEGVNMPIDEIELELRMEPLTLGTIYFDDPSLVIFY